MGGAAHAGAAGSQSEESPTAADAPLATGVGRAHYRRCPAGKSPSADAQGHLAARHARGLGRSFEVASRWRVEHHASLIMKRLTALLAVILGAFLLASAADAKKLLVVTVTKGF